MRVLAVAALIANALAAPTVNYPFNNQLPPVAEWGKPYSYTFSSDTFKSGDGSAVSIRSSDLPSWLSLNDHTISGTPSGGSGDQMVSFHLTASDSSGETQEPCNLQLTGSSLPSYSPASLENVLRESGAIANENSFVLVPNREFEVQFPSNFFTSDGRSVIGHYAVQSDHSPLPIWLNFDGAAGKFSGTAPAVNSEIAQAQQFSILYIVSTYQGFESAAANFNMLLGANVLSMNISQDGANATVGEPFSYNAPLSEVTLNNQPVTPANLSSAKASIPGSASWLSWDASNYTLLGTPPPSAAGSTVSVGIEIVDTFNDAVSWNVSIDVSNKTGDTVFSTSSLPAANATRGKWFEYDLESYILDKSVSIELSGPAASWLSMHDSNWTINGQVPYSFQNAMLNLTAKANNNNQQKRDSDNSNNGDSLTAHLELYGVGPQISSSMASSSSRASSSSMSSSRMSSSVSSSMSRTTSMSRSSSRVSSQSNSLSHSHRSSARSISATGSATQTGSSSTASSSASSSGGLMPINKKSSSNGVAIGCGVGIPVALAALAALGLLLFCRRRRKNRAAAAEAGEGDDGDEKFAPEIPGGAQISAPRPTSKGIAMAPVFRTDSASGSEYEDALEYPGELGDDGTVYGTPDKVKDADDSWNSPQRASTLNFMAMDGNSSSEGKSDVETLASLNPYEAGGAAPPPHREEDDVLGEIPRESWRHTNTGERRWQDARLSQSSLASIVPTEPPTVQLASEQFAPYQPQDTEQQMSREYSSGIIHRVGSNTSSHYTESVRQSRDPRISGHYRTESSTESQNSQEFSDSSSGGVNLRPYRDENGELHWRQENPGEGTAKLNSVGLDRKPSAAKTPNGDQGEFVFV